MTQEEYLIANQKVVDDLMRRRFVCIAEYPYTDELANYQVGDVFSRIIDQEMEGYVKYPKLFRELEWWEYRSIDELMAVNFVEILFPDKPGYHLPGDWVDVSDYVVNTKLKKFVAYDLGSNKKVIPKDCRPAARKCNRENQPKTEMPCV